MAVDREQLIAGLRELADWYEQHPDVPLPLYPDFRHCVLAGDDTTGTAEVRQVAAALGVPVTTRADGSASAERTFAGLEFRVYHVGKRRMKDYQDDQELLRTAKGRV